jgi:hypothetical protein
VQLYKATDGHQRSIYAPPPYRLKYRLHQFTEGSPLMIFECLIDVVHFVGCFSGRVIVWESEATNVTRPFGPADLPYSKWDRLSLDYRGHVATGWSPGTLFCDSVKLVSKVYAL